MDAEEGGRKAVELARALPDSDGPENLVASLNLLGAILQGLGRAADAIPLYREALALAIEARARVVAMANLGSAEREVGQSAHAEAHLTSALALAKGEVPDEVPGLLDKLGRVLHQTNRRTEALAAFAERVTLTSMTDQGGQPSEEHLDALFHLAAAEASEGRHAEASSHYADLAEKLSLRGERHSLGRAQALTGLALAEQACARYPQAVAAAREALIVRESVLGREHPELLSAKHNLAHVLLASGKAREAEPLAREVVAAARERFPAEDGRLQAAMVVLAGVLERTGRLREAVNLRKQLSNS